MQEGRKEGRMDGWMDEILYVERKYCLVMVVSYVLTICKHLLTFVKHCLEFSFEFSAPFTCLKKPVFTKAGRSAVEGTSQAVLGSCRQRKKVPASLSLFLKSAKIPALLYVGQGPAYRALLLCFVVTRCLTYVGTWTQDGG
jgi:hypothetical protein